MKPSFLGADRGGSRAAPGAEAGRHCTGAMDYLFGIVVLLCGVVQAGRGAKPKHNVPRLKLSYKGKPPASTPRKTEQRCCFQSSLSSLFLASGCSFMLSFSCTLSC